MKPGERACTLPPKQDSLAYAVYHTGTSSKQAPVLKQHSRANNIKSCRLKYRDLRLAM